MSVYAFIKSSNVIVKEEKQQAALEAVKSMNSDHTNKIVGRPGEEERPENSKSVSDDANYWFRWLEWNYDELVDSLEEFLDKLDFGTEKTENGDLVIDDYANKTGDEELFFRVLAPFIESGSYIEWETDYNSKYRWDFDGKEMTVTVKN